MASPLKSIAGWVSRVSRIREARRRRQRRRLLMEPLEHRVVLAANDLAAILGTAFIDATDDGLTGGDSPVAAVNVSLYQDGGDATFDAGLGGGDDTLIGTQATLANGTYRFDDLLAGTYFVQQAPAAGLLQRPAVQVQTVTISTAAAQGVIGSPIDSYDDTTQTAEAAASGPVIDATTALARIIHEEDRS